MRSTSGAASSLMSTLILVSHASFAPFVPHARIISFLSGHAIKISQQSHKSGPTDGGISLSKGITAFPQW